MLHLDKEKPIQKVKCEKKGQKIIRALWLAVGLVCVGLGAIGIVLPILPTTPFLLAAAACFCKSSTRMYDWLLSNKWFGEYIRNYKEGRGLPLRTKITCTHGYVGHDWHFNSFFIKPSFAVPINFAITNSDDSCCCRS